MAMKKILLTILLVAAQVAAADAAANPEREELLAIFTENRAIYDACYTLAAAQVLTSDLREKIVASADKRKGMACALAITSNEAGIRVTDAASLDRLQAYFTKKKWCIIAEVDLKNARNVIELFYLDNARYPATLAEATASSAVQFKSVLEYRQADNPPGYQLTATNDGCDHMVDFDSRSSVFSTRPKGPAPGGHQH
jgi:hypothetical protein